MSDFCTLLEPQIPMLRRYARALLHDPVRADDLVQDTLVRALAKQHLWQPGTNLRAWLFTVMHNLHVTGLRQSARDGTMVDVEDVSATLIATTDPTASRQLTELEYAIAHLSVEQREVLLLIGLEGVQYDEAAMILSVPIGTVRSRLSRARETLRKLLDRDDNANLRAIPRDKTAMPAAAA
jgi:RNA polymerase sigma-70 factor (ECF subfamily)